MKSATWAQVEKDREMIFSLGMGTFPLNAGWVQRLILLAEDEKRDFDMYRRAWIRSLGGKVYRKMHDIDALALTTERLREDTKRDALRECAKELLKTVTRADVVSLAEEWIKE